MSTRLSFTADRAAAEQLLDWWRGLADDPGGRARLRRCRTPGDVAFVRSYHELLHRLEKLGTSPYRPSLAAVAGLAAHVRSHMPEPSLPRQMAQPSQPGGHPKVSDLRFAALMATTDPDELYARLRRIIGLLGEAADLIGLAEGAYAWNAHTRRRWAYDYYAEAPRKAPGKEK